MVSVKISASCIHLLQKFTMSDEKNNRELRQKMEQLIIEHRDLDEVIHRLVCDPEVDQLQIVRMKKRKLYLKDMITRLRSKLIPDIEA